MKPGKGKIGLLLGIGPKKEKSDYSKDDAPGEISDDERDAASELSSAIKAGESEGVAMAFKNMLAACEELGHARLYQPIGYDYPHSSET